MICSPTALLDPSQSLPSAPPVPISERRLAASHSKLRSQSSREEPEGGGEEGVRFGLVAVLDVPGAAGFGVLPVGDLTVERVSNWGRGGEEGAPIPRAVGCSSTLATARPLDAERGGAAQFWQVPRLAIWGSRLAGGDEEEKVERFRARPSLGASTSAPLLLSSPDPATPPSPA